MTAGLRKALSKSKTDEAKGCNVEYVENGIQFIIENGTVKTILTEDTAHCKNGDNVRFIPGMRIIPKE